VREEGAGLLTKDGKVCWGKDGSLTDIDDFCVILFVDKVLRVQPQRYWINIEFEVV